MGKNEMKLISTRNAGVDRLKVLVHGPAGAGKTYLASTTGNHRSTIVLSAEAGLLSLREFEINAVEIGSLEDLRDAYSWIKDGCPQEDDSEDGYQWIILDSISEIAEACLADMKAKYKNGMQAYGEMGETMMKMLKRFRDLPHHVVMTCKQGREQDASGMMMYGPLLPGKMLTQNVSYLFDEVLALRVGVDEDGKPTRTLQCQRDNQYDCKDRSGSLDLFEEPSLNYIWTKIKATVGENNA
jgi:hypothetical protein